MSNYIIIIFRGPQKITSWHYYRKADVNRQENWLLKNWSRIYYLDDNNKRQETDYDNYEIYHECNLITKCQLYEDLGDLEILRMTWTPYVGKKDVYII